MEDERAAIVAGSASVPTFDIPDSSDKDEGIPEFWLTAMSNHDAIGGLISDRDADVLAYLRDIRCAGGSGLQTTTCWRVHVLVPRWHDIAGQWQ